MASCSSNGSAMVSCACGCSGCQPHLVSEWTPEEKAIFCSLTSIPKIQDYVDALKYEAKPDGAFSPRMTIRWGHGHCFGGSLLAAAALRNLGHRPFMVHISTDPEVDDDHVICAYQIDGYWGAIAKSNYSTLRGRDPVYQSIRELAMSYFDFYFSSAKVKSMTGYSDPVALEQFDERGPGKQGWMYAEDNMEDLDRVLCYEAPHYTVVTSKMVPHLSPATKELLEASTLFTNWNGLFKPKAAPA